jgi:hypothetical protein
MRCDLEQRASKAHTVQAIPQEDCAGQIFGLPPLDPNHDEQVVDGTALNQVVVISWRIHLHDIVLDDKDRMAQALTNSVGTPSSARRPCHTLPTAPTPAKCKVGAPDTTPISEACRSSRSCGDCRGGTIGSGG